MSCCLESSDPLLLYESSDSAPALNHVTLCPCLELSDHLPPALNHVTLCCCLKSSDPLLQLGIQLGIEMQFVVAYNEAKVSNA